METLALLHSIAETEPRILVAGFLLALLFAGSSVVWWLLIERRRRSLPFLEFNYEPRAGWQSAQELAVIFVVLMLVVSSLIPRIVNAASPEESLPSLQSIATQALISLVLSGILIVASAFGRRSSEIGMTFDHLGEQLRIGVLGFLAAVLPMTISMAATLPFRGGEHQHSMLKLLLASPDTSMIVVIGFTAVIAAPIFEELLYRVILQGWLTSLYPPAVAIPAVAMMFAFVHGWRDGLALLPLALILGYVFHRSHRYLTVVVIHAFFNATMLTMQLLIPRT